MRAALSIGFAVFAPACLTTPRLEDTPALHDYSRELRSPPKPCGHHLELVRSPPLGEGDYEAFGTLSATCYPGAPAVCERSLMERGCELGADILVVVDGPAGGVPNGASGQSLSSMTARALRRKR